MIRRIIPIVCFVLAPSIFGCHKHVLPNHDVETNNPITKSARIEEKSNTVDIVPGSDESKPTLISYYFHRTVRCPMCLAIEADAAGVINENFQHEIDQGSLMWVPFNLDDPGGEEFEKKFDISVSTLLLAIRVDGSYTKYKKLEKVWEFVGDSVKFDAYVLDEVRQFLSE
jgi:hypothetical protein